MGATSIQWTDRSINPIRARLRDVAHAGIMKGGYGSGVGHYCEKISSGCANCYSSGAQPRFGMPEFSGVGKAPADRGVELFFDSLKLDEVLLRKAVAKWFWCDMTDLFGSWVPDEWIDCCMAVMALTPRHTHQILTKRPERMAEYVARMSGQRLARAAIPFHHAGLIDAQTSDAPWPLPNVWMGTSVENQEQADIRVPHLLACPAAVRFLSCEPLLGPIDLNGLHDACVDWVIIGGESGPKARPCDVEWVRSLLDQCRSAGVPCFVKQLGASVFSAWMRLRMADSKGGSMLEWPADLRVREFPKSAQACGV